MIKLELLTGGEKVKSAGQLIKEKRKEKKLTLQDVANHLGCSKMTISKYERGEILNLRRDKLIPLCNLLDISPIQLIDSVEVEQTITINAFKTQLNFLLIHTQGLNDSEKSLIKNYVQLICENKNKGD